MENKMCAVVRDLFPLYKDDAIREESRQVIDEHLVSCFDCQDYIHKEIDILQDEKISPQNDDNEIVGIKKLASKLRRRRRRIVLITATGIFSIFILVTQVFQISVISGKGMEPTFSDMQDVVINRWAYLLSTPKRGDIIVFNHEENINVKRIIGLPGETVDIQNNHLYINGEILEKDYLYSNINDEGDVKYPIELGEHEYFILGDNLEHSLDSRFIFYGTLKRDDILGKVMFKTKNIIDPHIKEARVSEELN